MSLINKYRPKTFSEVVGQDKAVKGLIKSIKKNNIHNSYLFAGRYGIGKTTLARLLAKGINCENFKDDICRKCESCKGNDFDIIELDGATNRGIDEIRKIRRDSHLSSMYQKYKVYIIDEAHQLTSQASNAFLKTLEEPSSHTKFIFCTTEPNKLLSTIKSRCLPFYLKPIRYYDIKDRLEIICKKENINLKDSKVLFKIAELSNNTMRDAINNLELCINNLEDNTLDIKTIRESLNIISDKDVYNLLDYLVNNQSKKFFQELKKQIDSGHRYEDILNILKHQSKEIIFITQGLTKGVHPYKLKIIRKKNYSIKKIFKILKIINQICSKVNNYVNIKDTSELGFLQILLKI